jgi:hypothetical protein
LQIYRYFKKYQIEHEKKHSPKEGTKKRWDEFHKQQKLAKEQGTKSEGGDAKKPTEEKKEKEKEIELNPALPLKQAPV